jgi:hypothetical protein
VQFTGHGVLEAFFDRRFEAATAAAHLFLFVKAGNCSTAGVIACNMKQRWSVSRNASLGCQIWRINLSLVGESQGGEWNVERLVK